MAYRHIVLFRVHDGVTGAEVDGLIEALRELRSLPGITVWRVERSTDERKGVVIVEDATFRDRAAFDDFRDHPQHVAVGRRAAEVSDWWVGDYLA